MRRVYLRGRENIEKRMQLHVAGFNLGLLMRTLFGKGTPRGLQECAASASSLFSFLGRRFHALFHLLADLPIRLPEASPSRVAA